MTIMNLIAAQRPESPTTDLSWLGWRSQSASFICAGYNACTICGLKLVESFSSQDQALENVDLLDLCLSLRTFVVGESVLGVEVIPHVLVQV